MSGPVTILKALDDPKLFAPWFADKVTWVAWRAFLAALFGLPLTPEQIICGQCAGHLAE